MSGHWRLRRALRRLLWSRLSLRARQRLQGLARAWDIGSGSWREPELALLSSALRPGEWGIDIGANCGLYAYHMARAVGPLGRIQAFEPLPPTFALLRIVARLLHMRNVELIPRALGERVESATFTLPVRAGGEYASRLAHRQGRVDQASGASSAGGATESFVCQVDVLDAYSAPDRELAFIKIDIEGAELWALRGGLQLIARHRPSIQCEVDPRFLAGFGIELAELLELFSAQGYQHFRYVADIRQLQPVDATHWRPGNQLFIHPDRLQRFQAFLPAGMPITLGKRSL